MAIQPLLTLGIVNKNLSKLQICVIMSRDSEIGEVFLRNCI
jgi:hypothetical protein